jgi:hypothetical protein
VLLPFDGDGRHQSHADDAQEHGDQITSLWPRFVGRM